MEQKRSNNILNRILITLGFLIVIVYFYPHPSASHYKYEQGRPWNYAKLIAPFDVPIHPDSMTMHTALDSLNTQFVPVFGKVTLNLDSVLGVAHRRLSPVAEAGASKGSSIGDLPDKFFAAMSAYIRKAYAKGVIADSLPEPFNRKPSRIRMPEGKVLEEKQSSRYVTHSAMMETIDSIADSFHCERLLQNTGLSSMLKPSVVCDVEETMRLYENDKALITIDRGVIQRGQTIVDKGTIISAQDFTNLRTYETMLAHLNNETRRSDLLMILGQICYVGLLLLAFMGYIYFYEPKIWNDTRSVIFMLTAVTVFFLVTVALSSFTTAGIYLAPLTIVPVLILVFFNSRTALWSAIVLTLLCAGVTSYALEFLIVEFTGAVAAVFSLRDLTQRSQLLRTSLFVGLAYMIAYVSVQLMMNGSFDDFSWRFVGALMVSAVLTSVAYVLMLVVEKVFGFVSNVTLVELADTNSPLLRELSDECPGTFQHSMAVATLAGDAARIIGANTLLVRAGAMYHDIGKLNNPIFFTENQHGVNPHDGLSPQRSAEIIISHVTDGLKRAEKAKLPEMITDFISQHHGKGKAKYFYITACRQNPDETVDPAPFTYPGPNPQSREASVLMMADSVEAASRSLKEHTPQAINELVNRIIDGQIAEGLHNDSNISFRDVAAIKKAFAKRLMTLYHSRISYPDEIKAAKPASK